MARIGLSSGGVLPGERALAQADEMADLAIDDHV